MIRFSLISRPDGKIALFSPEARQSLVATKGQFEQIFVEITKKYPELMPTETYQSLGLSFGSMAMTTWKKIISLAKKLECEIIE